MFILKKYEIHPELFYDPKDHFWLKVDANIARIGMEPLEQESKGAFVVVQLDQPGKHLKRGDSFGSIEAEKHVGSLLAPVSGKITSVNLMITENPRLANSDPYDQGWFVEVELTDFKNERSEFITGEKDLRNWYESEISRYSQKGWLAEL